MKKKILCFALSLIMIVGASLTVHAEDYYGSNEWLAVFNGDEIESNFSSEELADDMVNVQPGDSITFEVNLQNDSSIDTYWYMKNEVLQTLEESNQSAEGGAYTYILSYIDEDGSETVFYSSEVVGGEDGDSQEGEGLHQATSSLEDYFYIDTLAEAETGVIRLYVKIEGETTGTDYQETLAKLQMNFAVEKVTEGKVITTVKTGDVANIMLYSTLLLLSGLVLSFIAMRTVKNRRDQKGV